MRDVVHAIPQDRAHVHSNLLAAIVQIVLQTISAQIAIEFVRISQRAVVMDSAQRTGQPAFAPTVMTIPRTATVALPLLSIILLAVIRISALLLKTIAASMHIAPTA